MLGFAKRLGARLAAEIGLVEDPKLRKREAGGTAISERIRARYISNCKQRPSSRRLMREYGVVDDWREALER